MKKVLVFLYTVSLFFGVVSLAGATPLTFNSVDGWWYRVQAEGKITLDGLDTFSYCVERQQHISIGGTYNASIREIDSNYFLAAQLMATFAPSLHGAYGIYSKIETGAALQLAIWSAVGMNVSDITDSNIWNLADYMMSHVTAPISGIFYADLGGNQDLLVANSTPAPATMLLFGSGLIGLAVVGRRKFK